MKELYVGLISGTSVDGVDAVLAEFDGDSCRLLQAATFAYPPAIAGRLTAIIDSPTTSLRELGGVDVAVGRFFADCTLALLREAGVSPSAVRAIGHHGQTVFHQPLPPEPFSMQLGDPNSVAAITGIDTVADLRGLDVALGGQGAPLVPAFHDWLFRSDDSARVVANIGGIANLTVLVPGASTTGFDTGPGNTLLDAWCRRCLGNGYDDAGRWASGGSVDESLLAALLDEPYFRLAPPKSTGRELFNLAWLEPRLDAVAPLAEQDVQATLVELTAGTIATAIDSLGLADYELFVCGGGAYNDHLLARLTARTGRPVTSTTELGIAPDWVEAAAFAWLARARVHGEPGNVATVTGAPRSVVLGGLYSGVKE